MLLFTATALAVNLGWPCTRMNWAWRNVWATCSINSYVPTDGPIVDQAPSHWRAAPLDLTIAPTSTLDRTGIFTADGDLAAGTDKMFCDAMKQTKGSTGTGFQLLRNRCRRAIDAYGGIVDACHHAGTPTLAGNRGPIDGPLFPHLEHFDNYEPRTAQVPHVTNVANLAALAKACVANDEPFAITGPSYTCPGLLGWFTVVWNACHFSSPTVDKIGPGTTPNVAPLGGVLTPNLFLAEATSEADYNAPDVANSPSFIFCSPKYDGTASPLWLNTRGAAFRTTRCRKALDQFGRTAARCTDNADMAGLQSDVNSPVVGIADALHLFNKGPVAAASPLSLLKLAPLCN